MANGILLDEILSHDLALLEFSRNFPEFTVSFPGQEREREREREACSACVYFFLAFFL